MHHSLSLVQARRTLQRGLTLVELMIVIAIIGILATIASVSVKKYIASSKTSEAIQMIGTIKAAQESYKDETFNYMNVSPGISATSDFYPNNPSPGQKKMNFAGSGTGQANWATLGVHADAPVLFVYASTAGIASAKPTATGSDITVANWPSAALGKPWYIVKARADLDGDGVNTVFITGSFAGEIFAAND
ncbi:MAG TPA: prepilin-type N-terminal cleavage/methylation domain-containing protein [Polyangiaceae bacterium]|nr:prepilin-type N-terminal cleavage/methylation domain-containing protein [Polyangiaceae bacterium]